MLALGVETSCDDTCVGIVDETGGVLSSVRRQQLEHSRYGGIVPELAARAHNRAIQPVYRLAMENAGVSPSDMGLVAATRGPGLAGSLVVGYTFARALAYGLGVPFRGVNHLTAHLFSAALDAEPLIFPIEGLVVSGGHTALLLGESPATVKVAAQTRDDACGEAFDKVAKLLGLPFPGGAHIEELAKLGKPGVSYTVARTEDNSFSYSGLKTAVLYSLREDPPPRPADVALGFQKAALAQIIDRVKGFAAGKLVVGGGVTRNEMLRKMLAETGVETLIPQPRFCEDNGAMVALAGMHLFEELGPSPDDDGPDPSLLPPAC